MLLGVRRVSSLRSCSSLSTRGDEVLPRVTVAVLRAFVKALIAPRKLNQRSREFDFWVGQLVRLRRSRPLITALNNLRLRGVIERADPVLTLQIEKVEHASWLVHESYHLDAVGVEDPVDLLAKLLISGALFTANSSLMSKRQVHRGCTK